MKRLRRLPAAIADADDIWFYIAQENVAAAQRMIERISDATARLPDFPASGSPRPDIHPEARSIPVGQYVVYYRIGAEAIDIVRVVHAARDAGTIIESFNAER
jgi:toxin ParE1/3/4